MGYYDYGYWPRYVSVGEKRARARHALEKLRKKNPNIRPIVLAGSRLAGTWWGKAWNKNLERYADYANRIGRGRSYLRHGTVLDLQIAPGKVRSLVQGSGRTPYQVEITIDAIGKTVWQEIKTAAAGELASLQELLDGHFPKRLSEIFTAQGKGLFPSPKEIRFACSCPDWASMCKHVAATLYGIGARLDEDPGLFFVLRKVKIDDLVSQTLQDQSEKLLKKAKRKTSRVIDDTDLGDVFGIDLDEAPDAAKEVKRKVKTANVKVKRAGPKRKVVMKKTARKKAEGRGQKAEGRRTENGGSVGKKTKKKAAKKTAKKATAKKKTVKKKNAKKKAAGREQKAGGGSVGKKTKKKGKRVSG